MSDHTTAFVPIPTWEYQSPELHKQGIQIDIGLLAEALVYYDKLLVYPGNRHEFASFVRWFIQRGQINELIALLREGTIQIYDYAFLVQPFVHEGQIQLLNITDEVMSQPNPFARRYINNGLLINEFSSHQEFDQFQKAIEDKVIEVKIDGFGPTVENATADYFNPKRNALLTQVFLDDSYALNGLGMPPEVEVLVRRRNQTGKIDVSWNFDVESVAKALGIKGVDTRVSPGLALLTFPLSAAANANRYLLSAMKEYSDLYLPQPISIAIGDKLYEASIGQTQIAIEELQEDVDFPDLRLLLNRGEIGFQDVLLFRRKGVKFRKWLQDEAERDRRALFAYHKELAEEVNFTQGVRKSLRLFGALGGGSALGTALGVTISPDPLVGGVTGSLIGSGLTYLLGEGLVAGWKPVAFGNWYAGRIAKIREANEAREKLLTPLGLNQTHRHGVERRLKNVRKRNKRKRRR